jgi:hypothetical protein
MRRERDSRINAVGRQLLLAQVRLPGEDILRADVDGALPDKGEKRLDGAALIAAQVIATGAFNRRAAPGPEGNETS